MTFLLYSEKKFLYWHMKIYKWKKITLVQNAHRLSDDAGKLL